MLIHLLATLTILSLTRIIYLIFWKNGPTRNANFRESPAKTLIVLGSGGHTTEMTKIMNHLRPEKYSPRIYVRAENDELSSEKIKELERGQEDFKISAITRSRQVHQSYFSSIWSTLSATFESLSIFWTENPDLLLCNGPGTCVPICAIAFILKFFFITNTMDSYEENLLTTQEISWDSIEQECEENIPDEIKVHVSSIFKALRFEKSKGEKLTLKWMENSLLRAEACLDRIWETLNSGYWKTVPINYRYAYSICSVLKAILLEKKNRFSEINEKKLQFLEIIKQIDKGLLLGAPLPKNPALLTDIATKVNNFLVQNYERNCENSKKVPEKKQVVTTIFPGFLSVPEYFKPSMETFNREIFSKKVPAILKGCLEHWRALDLWQDINYLEKIAGPRTVPIEIGSKYTEEDWAQSLITFSDFIKKHVDNKNEKIGYLAQHQLFEQVPELKNDFSIPDYCSFTDNEEECEIPDINVWFGPEGTVSPLHFDPKNNILCQVFGYKRIILYSPEDSENLYPYETRLLKNTAQVDPYRPNDEKWPNFRKAKCQMCYLKPGEMLFIPPKWWHHVVSLSSSFSISFWWN